MFLCSQAGEWTSRVSAKVLEARSRVASVCEHLLLRAGALDGPTLPVVATSSAFHHMSHELPTGVLRERDSATGLTDPTLFATRRDDEREGGGVSRDRGSAGLLPGSRVDTSGGLDGPLAKWLEGGRCMDTTGTRCTRPLIVGIYDVRCPCALGVGIARGHLEGVVFTHLCEAPTRAMHTPMISVTYPAGAPTQMTKDTDPFICTCLCVYCCRSLGKG